MIERACLDCGAPSLKPRCPICRSRIDRLRPSAAQRGYGAAHRRTRAELLTDRPYCEGGHGDELVRATQVHHIDGNTANNHPANLTPLCGLCHGRLEAEQRRTRDTDGRWAA